jgi:hypothetical protein
MKTAIRSSRLGAEVKANAATNVLPSLQLPKLLPASSAVWLAALLAVSWCAQAAVPAKTTKAEPATKAPAPPVQVEIAQSVFVIPASPKEGRNPFFPHSTATAPTQKAKDPVVDTSAIVLNGITSKPFPSVMINGMTFEKGEEHEVKLPTGGKLKVRCEDIRQDSALVLVNGVRRELRIRTGL